MLSSLLREIQDDIPHGSILKGYLCCKTIPCYKVALDV